MSIFNDIKMTKIYNDNQIYIYIEYKDDIKTKNSRWIFFI
jgi:hypothetical protein